MGQHFQFDCPTCRYSTHVSGGDDRGILVGTTTVSCRECQRLWDIVTVSYAGTESNPAPAFRCPESAQHHIIKWRANDPCPRCGAVMHTGDIRVLWD